MCVSSSAGPRVTASDLTYHTQCFLCAGCHKPFGKARFQLKDGEPYHTECFKLLYNPRYVVAVVLSSPDFSERGGLTRLWWMTTQLRGVRRLHPV